MKKETKELIQWIKTQINKQISDETTNKDIKDYGELFLNKRKAFEFLDGLEDFEKQLKQGGFIPDCNNKPCKHGDVIEAKLPISCITRGTLKWDNRLRRFVFLDSNNYPYDIMDYDFWRVS